MSSSQMEMLRSTICRGFSIPELIKIIKPSCGKYVLNAVVTTLEHRERDMAAESLHLMEELHKKMEELDSKQEKELKLEDELKHIRGQSEEWEKIKRKDIEQYEGTTKSLSDSVLILNKKIEELKSKCKEFEDMNEKLTEEQNDSNAREKRFVKELEEKTNLLLHTNAKNLEIRRLLQESQEKTLQVNATLAKMGQEIVEMGIEKSMLNKKIEELKGKIDEASQNENEMKDVKTRLLRMEEIIKYINVNPGCIEGNNIGGNPSGEKIIKDSPIQSAYTPHLGRKQGSGSNPCTTIPVSSDVEIIQIDDNEIEMNHMEATAAEDMDLVVQPSAAAGAKKSRLSSATVQATETLLSYNVALQSTPPATICTYAASTSAAPATEAQHTTEHLGLPESNGTVATGDEFDGAASVQVIKKSNNRPKRKKKSTESFQYVYNRVKRKRNAPK